MKKFSRALLREPPETRTAVRDCMSENSVKGKYPMTHKVLREAPNITWPSDMAYHESWAEAGQMAPPKDVWTR